MRGRNKTKSVAIKSPDSVNFKSLENINERHVFEKLCLDTSLSGFSYDPSLLVDLDKVSSFDEACIRLTTKCGSIVTQLSSVGHNVTDFAVASTVTATGNLASPKTPIVPKIPESPVSLFSSQKSPSNLYFLDSQTSPILSPTSLAKRKFQGFDCTNKETLTPQDNRNIRVMGELWEGLKKKNYTGMVAVARVTGTSLPNNSSKDRYSIKALSDTLLSNIKGYFMFQNFSSTFDKDFHNSGTLNYGKNNNSEPGGEYLLYVVYRSKAEEKETKNSSAKKKATDSDKLSSPWSTYVPANSRKLRHESGDSAVSSSSSISSTTSGGPCSFSVPSGKTSNLKLDIRQDSIIAMGFRGMLPNPKSYSSPQVTKSPSASQTRTLITPPSPTTPKVSTFQVVQAQKLFSPPKSEAQTSLKSPTISQRNLRHQPYKQQQTNSLSDKETTDTVSKAINTAIASVSPKNQSQSLFTNQVKQQKKTPIKIDTRQQEQNKQAPQLQTQQNTRLQQQKSREGTITAAKWVPITAPKSEGPTKNLRSSPAAAPAPISQRNLRHSFTKK